MAITKDSGRQYSNWAEITFAGSDLTQGGTHPAFDLPAGAVVVGGELIVDTAFGTGVTLSLGDAVSSTRYLNATTLNTTGRTALTLTGYRHVGGATPSTLLNAVISNNAITAGGSATIRLSYTQAGRANEQHG